MKKFNESQIFVISVAILVLVLIFIGSFLIDIGINSKYFIEKRFNQAFQYRVTGDCDSFANYIYRDVEKWRSTCEREKANKDKPIRNFKIQNISHKLGSNRAFLQIELTRTISGKDYIYSVSYEMKKVGLKWKIDQEKK